MLDAIERVKPRGLVLVADDDPDFAGSIEPVLKQSGYVVEIARNGQEALEKSLGAGHHLPGARPAHAALSGLEVYLRLKETGAPVPTIFVTGCAEELPDAIRQVNGFGQGLLIKPFDPAHLLRAMEGAALPRQAADAHAR